MKAIWGPRGVLRTSYWAVNASGDREKDWRAGRALAPGYIEHEYERQRADPEAPPVINSIIADIVASGDRSGLADRRFLAMCGRLSFGKGELNSSAGLVGAAMCSTY